MSIPDDDTVLDRRLGTMRIIFFTLLTGVVIFLVIALVVRANGNMGPPPATPLLTYFGLAFAALQLVLSTFIPDRVAAQARRKMPPREAPARAGPEGTQGWNATDRGPWYAVYQTRLIIGMALLEGAAFLLTIAYLVEGYWLSIAGVVVLLAAMAARYPTRSGVDGWADRQQELLREERMGV